MSRPIWFKAKRYGWGWYPATWQGWLVIAVYILVVSLIFKYFDGQAVVSRAKSIEMSLMFLVSTIALVVTSFLFGEKPGWHWGK